MHGARTYKRNSNEKCHLYCHVFATDCEIVKGRFPARNSGVESANVIHVACSCTES